MMNKVVLITGGARRIGAETANYLHSKGMNILITYSKSASAARALRKSLNSKREKSCEIYRVEFKSNLNYKKVVRISSCLLRQASKEINTKSSSMFI